MRFKIYEVAVLHHKLFALSIAKLLTRPIMYVKIPVLYIAILKSIAFYMKKIALIVTLFLFGLSSSASFASYGSEECQPIYGGGETCITTSKFIIDKKVLNPEKTKGGVESYVDNLFNNDPKYVSGQNIKFQLVVTNTGDSAISELTLSDTIPSYVNFVSGPGTYDAKSRTLNFQILNLNANESRKYFVEVKVKNADSLPSGQGTPCAVNQALVKSGNDESRDNSQFCIEKKTTKGGLPVLPAPGLKQTPATGPEMLGLIGLIPAGLAGLLLRRKSK